MRSCGRQFLALAGVISLGLAFSPAARAVPNEAKVYEMAPGVYFRKAQTQPVFTGCNQGWVIFKDFVLVIDANFPGQAEFVLPEIRKTTDKPIKYVFDTHYHGDHADGNQQYAGIGATVVAHERSQALFQTKGIGAFTEAKSDPNRKEEYGPLEYAMPSLYFSHKLVFDDGEQRVELLFLGHAHTAGDAVAWLPKHGILFTGDACVNGAFNYTGDGNTESWISALNGMEDLGVKQVAPGHGELSDAGLIALQRRYFVELRGAVKEALGKGKKLDEIKNELDLPFYKEWTGEEAKSRVENIEHVFGEMTNPKSLKEETGFREWEKLPGAGQYAALRPWESVGSAEADQRWGKLADYYLESSSTTRRGIREWFNGNDAALAEMRNYVRRISLELGSSGSVDTLRRGLAITAIEGGRSNLSETLISLQLLRYASQLSGIDSDEPWRQIQDPVFLAPENKPLFELVRIQRQHDLRQAALAYGPPGWRDSESR